MPEEKNIVKAKAIGAKNPKKELDLAGVDETSSILNLLFVNILYIIGAITNTNKGLNTAPVIAATIPKVDALPTNKKPAIAPTKEKPEATKSSVDVKPSREVRELEEPDEGFWDHF